MIEPACYRAVCEFKVADVVAEKPGGMHVSEISRKVPIVEAKLGRIMRTLASRHCFREGYNQQTTAVHPLLIWCFSQAGCLRQQSIEHPTHVRQPGFKHVSLPVCANRGSDTVLAT